MDKSYTITVSASDLNRVLGGLERSRDYWYLQEFNREEDAEKYRCERIAEKYDILADKIRSQCKGQQE